MALALAQSVVEGSNAPIVYGSNVTKGDLLVIGLVTNTGGAITFTSITDTQGNVWKNEVNTARASIWWTRAQSSGANTVTVAPASGWEAYIFEIKGFTSPPSRDKSTTATGANTTPSAGPLATTSANEFLLAMIFFSGTATGGGAGWTATVTPAGNLQEFIFETQTGSFLAQGTPSDIGWEVVFATFSSSGGVRARLLPLGI